MQEVVELLGRGIKDGRFLYLFLAALAYAGCV